MNIAVILAGGIGSRLGLDKPKQFMKMAGKTILEHTVDVFHKHENIDEIVNVINAVYLHDAEEMVLQNHWNKVKKVLNGGSERYESSLVAINAYKNIAGEDTNLIFHDAVRPMVSKRIIDETIAALGKYDAVDVAIPSADTIIKLDEKILRLVSIIGVPNKIMGALIGGLKSLIVLYFLLSILYVSSSFLRFDPTSAVGDFIVDMPVLNNTFGNVLDSFDDITELAVEYENIQDKQQLNNESIDILLEYGIITEENLEVLINAGKVQYSVDNADEQKGMMEDIYDAFIKGD
jgi:molybdopterin-guanine dinucleotide biosynthesis protein A